jgi:hypothetical protein
MEQIAEVYARALFEVAQEKGGIDSVRAELGEFDDALKANPEVKLFFTSPEFSTEEKKDGLRKSVEGGSPEVMNFLEALLERHRMPAIHRIRERFDEMWRKESKILPVTLTSAVALDPSTVAHLKEQIGAQTGSQVLLEETVDPDIIGGIVVRVGNQILDASIRTRLEQLRRTVAAA